jgi:serine/threonine-protein kinase RsbW
MMTQEHLQTPPVLTATCESRLDEVRDVLVKVDAFLRTACAPAEWIEDVNIILAEVLSNIARHGYPDENGPIFLEVHLGEHDLRCRVTDNGVPFDPYSLGNTAPVPEQLREGGYGWFLIRSLARGLDYCRTDQANTLTFWVPVSALAHASASLD